MAATLQTSGAGVFTPDGYAEALLKFGESINPAIKRGLWRSAKIVRAIFIARFTSRGVGKGIFGKKKSGAYKLVKVNVAGPRGSLFIMQLQLVGFAALQETGGRTLPHPIPKKGPKPLGKALLLKVPSVGLVFRRQVQHPGSQITADPSALRALTEAQPRIRLAINDAITEFQFKGVRLAA